MTLLEICVDDPAGIVAAVAGGADRLEVCAALGLGGLTPSPALVALGCRIGGARVHAMVRPRAGDFCYGEDEVALAIAEARVLAAAGADGLVFGATRDGALDEGVLARWVEGARAAAPAIALTLHRAIDTVADPVAAVAVAARAGFDRILTSGGRTSAVDGAATIAAMVRAGAGEGIAIIAGAGVRPDNVAALIAATGVREVHASASAPAPDADERTVALGFDTPPRRITDQGIVRALRDAIDRPQD